MLLVALCCGNLAAKTVGPGCARGQAARSYTSICVPVAGVATVSGQGEGANEGDGYPSLAQVYCPADF